jgi:hypothetical protein
MSCAGNNYIVPGADPCSGGGGGGGGSGVNTLNALTGDITIVGSPQITVTPSGTDVNLAFVPFAPNYTYFSQFGDGQFDITTQPAVSTVNLPIAYSAFGNYRVMINIVNTNDNMWGRVLKVSASQFQVIINTTTPQPGQQYFSWIAVGF